jgi:hypothetical protein
MMHGQSVVNPNGRIFVVGDLHGVYDLTIELLNQCQVNKNDVVIFTGDLIDRGPDNDKCVDLAMKIESEQNAPACILGNHEERHLYYWNLDVSGKDPNVTIPTHIETRKQLRPEHYEYFNRLPYYIRLPEYNSVVVHAGVFPGINIEQQDPYIMLHVQMINPSEATTTKWPSKAPSDWKFWTHHWTGPEHIIFGHSVLTKPLVTEHVTSVDGGAVFGLELWALELPSRKIHRIKANKNYGGGSRGRTESRVKIYNVHGDVGTYS